MTAAAREAILLPVLFLTVAMLGGLRIAEDVSWSWQPPPLFTLVLALLLVGTLVRCRAFAPEHLMNQSRSTPEQLNGVVILLAVFVASAQAFSLVTPDTGLPRALCVVLFFILLLNTLASSLDRSQLLGSLLVIFGSGFVLKFIVLSALSRSPEGFFPRLFYRVFDELTLEMVFQPELHASTGYVAFLTLVLFAYGLIRLPTGEPGGTVPAATGTSLYRR